MEASTIKVYKKMLQYTQMPKSSSKVLCNLDFFFMLPFIVVLGTQL